MNFERDYAIKSKPEQKEIKKALVNQLVDPEMYKTVTSYRAGPKAVQKSQERVQMMVTETNAADCPTDAKFTDFSIKSGVKPYPTITEEDNGIGTGNDKALLVNWLN